jgi:hypothetical protein
MSYGLELCELKKERVMRMCVRKSVCVCVYVCVCVCVCVSMYERERESMRECELFRERES